MSQAAAWVALGWAVVATTLGLIAAVKRRAQISRARALTDATPQQAACLLIRPCAGDEPTLERCLRSAASAHRSFELDVVVGVSEPDDAAVPAILRACQALGDAGVQASLEVHPPRGPNRKAAILGGVTEKRFERYDVVLNADSNVDLEGYDLDLLVGPLRGADSVGAVWAPPVELSEGGGLGNRASRALLGGSLHAFGLLAGLDPHGLVGKLFAVRSDALRATGGFGDFTDYLGEDTELSRRLRANGSLVLPAPEPIRSYAERRSFWDPVARQARWMAVIRSQRPALLLTYPLFFFPLPFVLALAALGAVGAPLVAAAAALLALVGQVNISMVAQRFCARSSALGAALVDVALGHAVMMCAFGRALRSTRFEWRGHRLRIERGGKLVADEGS